MEREKVTVTEQARLDAARILSAARDAYPAGTLPAVCVLEHLAPTSRYGRAMQALAALIVMCAIDAPRSANETEQQAADAEAHTEAVLHAMQDSELYELSVSMAQLAGLAHARSSALVEHLYTFRPDYAAQKLADSIRTAFAPKPVATPSDSPAIILGSQPTVVS